jgi:hypothetical protein
MGEVPSRASGGGARLTSQPKTQIKAWGGNCRSLDRFRMLNRCLVFCGDVFRVAPDGSFAQAWQVRLLDAILGDSLSPLFADKYVTDTEFGGLAYASFYDQLYGESARAPIDCWAAAHCATTLPDFAETVLSSAFENAFVVVFEAAPSLTRWMARNFIPYVDVRVHPARFLSDLVLSFYSNVPTLQARLMQFSMKDAFLRSEINFVRAVYAHRSQPAIPDGVIFLPQTSYDATLIEDGEFISLINHEQRLLEICRGRPTFIKPHPQEQDSRSVLEWRALFPDAEVLDVNFYEMIARRPTQGRFVTISSSAGFEAEAFGHQVTHLAARNWRAGSAFHSSYAHLTHEYWSPAFWRWAFELGDDMTAVHTVPFVPDRFRRAVQIRWSKAF